jgi:hypothetical protein
MLKEITEITTNLNTVAIRGLVCTSGLTLRVSKTRQRRLTKIVVQYRKGIDHIGRHDYLRSGRCRQLLKLSRSLR